MKRNNRNNIDLYPYVVSKEKPLSFSSEEYQKTVINLEYVNVDGKYKVIQLTSTIGSEGKSTTVANLAYLLGINKKVLILDLDLRKPKVHRIFEHPNENGLTDYLLGNIDKKTLIKHSEDLNIDFINVGSKTNAIINVLTANKLKQLIQELREQYDYIFIDSPPVLPVADSLSIAKLVDGIIFIVADNAANKKRTLEAFKAIEFTGAEIIGSIMTLQKVRGRKKNSYYYYD